MRIGMALLAAVAVVKAASPAAAQEQAWRGKNLLVFPRDITREALIQRMREFSFALGVRCQYCHAGGNGVSLEGVDFASDEKPAKVKARAMLRMVDQINGTLLPQLAARADPRVDVACVTCHRGLPLPKTLQTTLFETVTRQGAAAAVAQYRKLRADEALSGRYDFGEWEINELARRLVDAGKRDAAIEILDMNGEFYPKSADIDFQLAELYRASGDRARALERYKLAVQKNPNHQPAKNRLAELEKP
jgi:tetratricopeptide (TPR) repeat protein